MFSVGGVRRRGWRVGVCATRRACVPTVRAQRGVPRGSEQPWLLFGLWVVGSRGCWTGDWHVGGTVQGSSTTSTALTAARRWWLRPVADRAAERSQQRTELLKERPAADGDAASGRQRTGMLKKAGSGDPSPTPVAELSEVGLQTASVETAAARQAAPAPAAAAS
eukprot:350272-Chlamydomonas_euryale.AAC.3